MLPTNDKIEKQKKKDESINHSFVALNTLTASPKTYGSVGFSNPVTPTNDQNAVNAPAKTIETAIKPQFNNEIFLKHNNTVKDNIMQMQYMKIEFG